MVSFTIVLILLVGIPYVIVEFKKDEKQHPVSRHFEPSEIDFMDGHDFEYYCASILKKNGFQSVQVTPGSGDQGVDIVATFDGCRYAIQCKRYSKDLGNTPVQEVNSGRSFYHCDRAVVMTNRYFTKGAIDLAAATDVELWDRDRLFEMIAAMEDD